MVAELNHKYSVSLDIEVLEKDLKYILSSLSSIVGCNRFMEQKINDGSVLTDRYVFQAGYGTWIVQNLNKKEAGYSIKITSPMLSGSNMGYLVDVLKYFQTSSTDWDPLSIRISVDTPEDIEAFEKLFSKVLHFQKAILGTFCFPEERRKTDCKEFPKRFIRAYKSGLRKKQWVSVKDLCKWSLEYLRDERGFQNLSDNYLVNLNSVLVNDIIEFKFFRPSVSPIVVLEYINTIENMFLTDDLECWLPKSLK